MSMDSAGRQMVQSVGVNDLICVRIDQKCSAFADKIADMFKHLAVIFLIRTKNVR